MRLFKWVISRFHCNNVSSLLAGPHLQGVPKSLSLINQRANRTNEGSLWATNRYGDEGYIGDERFTLTEAFVACRQLGFPSGAIGFTAGSMFRNGSYHYPRSEAMFYVQCQGGESHLQDCSYSGRLEDITLSRYVRRQSAGVVCNGNDWVIQL